VSEEWDISCPYCNRGEDCENLDHWKDQLRYAWLVLRNVSERNEATGQQEAIADPNPDKSTCVKTGRDNRTPENLCAVLSSEGEVEARFKIENVEWPEIEWVEDDARRTPERTTGPQKAYIAQSFRASDGYLSTDMTQGCEVITAAAYEALYAAFRSVSSGKVVRWEDISSAIARMAEKRDVAVEECKDLATSPAGKMIYWLESGAASATHLFAGRLSEELETAGSDQSGRPGGFVAGPSGLSQDSSGKGEG